MSELSEALEAVFNFKKENSELKRDKERLDYIDSIIEYKPPFYDGCEYGRFDLVFASNINDLRQAIDAAITATKPIDK